MVNLKRTTVQLSSWYKSEQQIKIGDSDDVQHNIICITPTQIGLKYMFDFVSEHVYKCVLESLRDSEANAATRLYRLFLKNRKNQGSGGLHA